MTYDRFDYARFRSHELAELAIEDFFASGEIDQTDEPQIERRPARFGYRYVVTLAGVGR
jgi:hypothetical protein